MFFCKTFNEISQPKYIYSHKMFWSEKMNFENKILNIKKNQILLNRLKDVGVYPNFVVQGPTGRLYNSSNYFF